MHMYFVQLGYQPKAYQWDPKDRSKGWNDEAAEALNQIQWIQLDHRLMNIILVAISLPQGNTKYNMIYIYIVALTKQQCKTNQ